MPFRFVHAADIHLDSPLRSLALRDPDLAELIGNATRHAFTDIIDLCLDEQVDALLLAGDLYDGEQTSMKTALFLAAQLRRLDDAGILTFIIRGNHDAMSRITRELTLPPSVKVFGGRAEAIELERGPGALPITIHGLSFAQPSAPESLLGRYRRPVDGAVNIGLMHTSLDGSPGHDIYAPCATRDLQDSGFDYWALGHIHKRSVIDGRCRIVMPGIPQGRDINEAGTKSVTLVTVGDDRTIALAEHATAVAQFERITVDLSAIDAWPDMTDAIGAALAARRGAVLARHLVARLVLVGDTPLTWRLRADPDLVHAEATSRAEEAGQCWIEGVELAFGSPSTALPAAATSAVAELRRLIHDDILPSEAYRAALADIAETLRSQLPPECRHLLGDDAEAARRCMAEFAAIGVEDVIARLQSASSGEPG